MSSSTPPLSSMLDDYDPLDMIGTGSFGIIRKVMRKSDGVILARKELHFERMSERDRKQIVAEVNILKDLNHENIVRYHDRFVDRENGILYILMEYCGGGDLASIIKQSRRQARPIPEDTIWGYFLQILLALHHCHVPTPSQNGQQRQQILHRDLKPENVFLDANNAIKLGDFGLSKQLGQASFANTYVGTPYYMSPELIEEKAYDTKSDIWSLGCLIYELCALNPPFHEAKTHAELSVFIRNGRIPPLPKGYSQSLNQVIRAMLNLNPAARPSTQQLLKHERIDLVLKVADTQKMLTAVKTHKQNVINKEREIIAREAACVQREEEMKAWIVQREAEMSQAMAKREEELHQLVMAREHEVRQAMEHREEELKQFVIKREEEIKALWDQKEEELRKEMLQREECCRQLEEALKKEAEKLDAQRKAETHGHGRKRSLGNRPLEDVQNTAAVNFPAWSRINQVSDETPCRPPVTRVRRVTERMKPPGDNTRNQTKGPLAVPGSAMKGVILTATGEEVATPTTTHLAKMLLETPVSNINFKTVFDDPTLGDSPTPPARIQKDSIVADRIPSPPALVSGSVTSTSAIPLPSSGDGASRLRRLSGLGPTRPRLPDSTTSSPLLGSQVQVPSVSQPPISGESTMTNSNAQSPAVSTTQPTSTASPMPPPPTYNLDDDEGLPSPFLKRTEKKPPTSQPQKLLLRRPSANVLRVMAATNSVNAAAKAAKSITGSLKATNGPRPSILRAAKAAEDAKKVLSKVSGDS